MDLKALKDQAQAKGLELLAKGRIIKDDLQETIGTTLSDIKGHAEREVPRLANSALAAVAQGAQQIREYVDDLKLARMQGYSAIDAKSSDPIGCRLAWHEVNGKRQYVLTDFAIWPILHVNDRFSAKCACSIPGRSVFTRTRTIPSVEASRIGQIVKYEIQQQIPFQLEFVSPAYQVLKQTPAGYDVIMAAIKTDVLEKNLSKLTEVGFRPCYITATPLAAYNWLKFNGEISGKKTTALIDLGAKTTEMAVERDGQFFFTRPIDIGGNDLTREMSSKLGWSEAKAEFNKCFDEIISDLLITDKLAVDPVIGISMNKLVEEIKRSFSYMRALPKGGTVDEIVLTGGGANMARIAPYFEAQFGIPTRIADPLRGLLVPEGLVSETMHNRMATVLGLALRCHEQTALDINFAK